MGVSSCCLDFEYTIVDGQERDIKGSPSEIVDNNLTFITSAVKTVCDSGGGRLIHNSNDIQAGNGASILCSLSLIVVEVRWNGDDGVDHLFPEIALCDFFHLSEYHGRDFFGGKRPVFPLNLDGDGGFVVLVCNTEREVLYVTLYVFVREFASNQSPAQPVSQVSCQQESEGESAYLESKIVLTGFYIEVAQSALPTEQDYVRSVLRPGIWATRGKVDSGDTY